MKIDQLVLLPCHLKEVIRSKIPFVQGVFARLEGEVIDYPVWRKSRGVHARRYV